MDGHSTIEIDVQIKDPAVPIAREQNLEILDLGTLHHFLAQNDGVRLEGADSKAPTQRSRLSPQLRRVSRTPASPLTGSCFHRFQRQGSSLTKHFEEELSLLRPRLVGGLAGVGTAVTLADVADDQHAAPALEPVDDVPLRGFQLLPFPAQNKIEKHR